MNGLVALNLSKKMTELDKIAKRDLMECGEIMNNFIGYSQALVDCKMITESEANMFRTEFFKMILQED